MTFSWQYRQHAHPPFWGPTTSKANFCEEDYIITAYIAELINTLTNITYLLYAFYGIKNNSNRKDAILRNLPYLGISGVGIGSIIFHATLLNYTQWCDDLSMLIATSTVLHRVFTYDKSLRTTVTLGLTITAFMAAFIAWHCYTDEITTHSILFGIMIAIVGIKTRSIISTRVSHPSVRKQVRKVTTLGSVTFISGFILWNIDNIYCGSLTEIKRELGMPWSFVLELHGWWHILTGCGAYIFIALVEYLTSEEAGQPLGQRFAWPVCYFIDEKAGMKRGMESEKYAGVFVNGHGGGVRNANGNGNSRAKKDL